MWSLTGKWRDVDQGNGGIASKGFEIPQKLRAFAQQVDAACPASQIDSSC